VDSQPVATYRKNKNEPKEKKSEAARKEDKKSDPPVNSNEKPGITMTSTDMKAVILVQRLFRGFKDRHKYRRRALLDAWDELEKKEESELRYTSKAMGVMTEMYSKISKNLIGNEEEKRERRPSAVVDREDVKSLKKGFKPTISWLTDFMDRVGKKGYDGKPMPTSDLMSILEMMKGTLKSLPNVIDIELERKQVLLIVGDLHGQVKDLLHILKEQGFPTKERIFLFNGDFVDRGKFSIEVCIILFCLKALFGDLVYLNRGNHEADDINARDGFQNECVSKYDMQVYHKFNEVFTTLPLVHIVNKKTMIVHGGLCWDAGVTIEKIRDIDRFVLHPPWESMMEDLLWSDPGGPKHAGASHNDRGCGCIFGEDIVDEFFEDNPPLTRVIRSHEKKESGFQSHFHGKVLTVFSASNYCGDNGNNGAVLELFPNLSYRVHTFYAAKNSKEGEEKFSDRYDTLSATVAAKLIHRIADNRLELLDYYGKCLRESKRPESKEPVITRVEWANGLKTVLKLNVKFLIIQLLLGVPLVGVNGKKKGKFNYVKWLAKFAPRSNFLKLNESKNSPPKVKESLEKISRVLEQHRFVRDLKIEINR